MITTYDSDGAATGAVAALLLTLAFSALYVVLLVGIYVLTAWFLRLGGQAGWWALVAFVPFVGIASGVFICLAAYNIGLRFGKTGAWVVLYILVPYVWWGIFAFDRSVWNPQPIAGIFIAPDWARPTSAVLRYVPQARPLYPPM
jgi:hypothetical protein